MIPIALFCPRRGIQRTGCETHGAAGELMLTSPRRALRALGVNSGAKRYHPHLRAIPRLLTICVVYGFLLRRRASIAMQMSCSTLSLSSRRAFQFVVISVSLSVLSMVDGRGVSQLTVRLEFESFHFEAIKSGELRTCLFENKFH